MTMIDLLRREFVLMRHHVTGIIQGLTKDELRWALPRMAILSGPPFCMC